MFNAPRSLPVCGMAIVVCLGCHNANPTLPSAPAPKPHAAALISKPTLNYFDAEPSSLSLGQSTSLRWSVENAAEVKIEPSIGIVKASDRLVVSPQETTTYSLKASNSGGTTEASLTVSVSKPIASSPGADESESGLSVLTRELRDVHFDYNQGEVTKSDQQTLE